MKAIQITIDESLLARLDADPEVRSAGRSAVFRRAVEAYLQQQRARGVKEAYRRAYGVGTPDKELEGWGGEGVWPDR